MAARPKTSWARKSTVPVGRFRATDYAYSIPSSRCMASRGTPLVSGIRAPGGRDWPRATRARRMVVAGPRSKAGNFIRQASRLGLPRERSCSASPAWRAVDSLGRRQRATAIAEARGKHRVKNSVSEDHSIERMFLSRVDFRKKHPGRLAEELVTKEVLCRGNPDQWWAWVGDHPGLPGPELWTEIDCLPARGRPLTRLEPKNPAATEESVNPFGPSLR